jgi:hypothetical protein
MLQKRTIINIIDTAEHLEIIGKQEIVEIINESADIIN